MDSDGSPQVLTRVLFSLDQCKEILWKAMWTERGDSRNSVCLIVLLGKPCQCLETSLLSVFLKESKC